jgi:PST family polysaccharide transporter
VRFTYTKNKEIIASTITGLIGVCVLFLVNSGKTKIVAVSLGVDGINRYGIYGSFLTLLTTVSSLGIGAIAINRICSAKQIGNSESINEEVAAMWGASILLAFLGASFCLFIVIYGAKISGSGRFLKESISILIVTVFLSIVATGWNAVIQSLDSVRKVTIINCGSALISLVSLWVLCVYAESNAVDFGYLVGAFASSVIAYCLQGKKTNVSTLECIALGVTRLKAIYKTGLNISVASLITTGASFVVRIFVNDTFGASAGGVYFSSCSIAGMYCGLILQAVNVGNLPKIAAAQTNEQINNIANQVISVSMIFALPGILATIALSDQIIKIFYTRDFHEAAVLINAQMPGFFLKVMAWPLGYVLLVKNQGWKYLCAEAISTVCYLCLVVQFGRRFGIKSVAIYYSCLYVFYFGLVYYYCFKMFAFRLSLANWFFMLISIFAIVAANYLFAL